MPQCSESLSTPELDYEGWREALRPYWGRYNPVVMEPKTFTGRAYLQRLYGFTAMELSCNAHSIERTQHDVRSDSVDHYFVCFQIAGEATIIQNDRVVQLAVGDAALVDSARPGTYGSKDGCGQWLSLQLPRRSLVSHLGVDLHGGILGRGGTATGRALFALVRDSDTGDGSTVSPADSYMHLAVYDLIGALFAPPDSMRVSLHANKLFKRICNIIREHFADPAFGPYEVAVEVGISLRYVQKLFTAQNSTCSDFIYSVRLNHAARLLERRELLRTNQPLSEIAYACGFSDYTNFSRKFRRRFGYSPSVHSGGGGQGTGDATFGTNPKSRSGR